MSIRLSGSFVTNVNQALNAAGIRDDHWGEEATHRQIEDFLDRLLDAGLVNELLRDMHRRHLARNPQLFLADSHILLDNKSTST